MGCLPGMSVNHVFGTDRLENEYAEAYSAVKYEVYKPLNYTKIFRASVVEGILFFLKYLDNNTYSYLYLQVYLSNVT